MAGESGVTGAGVTGTTLPAAGMALVPAAVEPGEAAGEAVAAPGAPVLPAAVPAGRGFTLAAGAAARGAGMNNGPFWPQPASSIRAAAVPMATP